MNRALFILSCLALLAGCRKQSAPESSGIPERIVSLAPNITETIYALELGDRLVGATTFCTYPEAAKNIPRVGGFGQFNFEAIVSLKPDLVILHTEYASEKHRLQNLGIPYLETESFFMADILKSIRNIGDACGTVQEADALIADINKRTPGNHKTGNAPRVLITFGSQTEGVDQIQAFGTECLHNELLELAGGKNVIENKLAFSVLSKEAVIRLNPDIIIQLAPGSEPLDNPTAAWKELSGVAAVRNNRIHVLTGDYTCIPGPRFIRILEDFEQLIASADQP